MLFKKMPNSQSDVYKHNLHRGSDGDSTSPKTNCSLQTKQKANPLRSMKPLGIAISPWTSQILETEYRRTIKYSAYNYAGFSMIRGDFNDSRLSVTSFNGFKKTDTIKETKRRSTFRFRNVIICFYSMSSYIYFLSCVYMQ